MQYNETSIICEVEALWPYPPCGGSNQGLCNGTSCICIGHWQLSPYSQQKVCGQNKWILQLLMDIALILHVIPLLFLVPKIVNSAKPRLKNNRRNRHEIKRLIPLFTQIVFLICCYGASKLKGGPSIKVNIVYSAFIVASTTFADMSMFYLLVRFCKHCWKSEAYVSTVEGADGGVGIISIRNSMHRPKFFTIAILLVKMTLFVSILVKSDILFRIAIGLNALELLFFGLVANISFRTMKTNFEKLKEEMMNIEKNQANCEGQKQLLKNEKTRLRIQNVCVHLNNHRRVFSITTNIVGFLFLTLAISSGAYILVDFVIAFTLVIMGAGPMIVLFSSINSKRKSSRRITNVGLGVSTHKITTSAKTSFISRRNTIAKSAHSNSVES